VTTCAEWKARLAAAETAYEDVRLGRNVSLIRMGEKEIRYSAGSANDLLAWLRLCQAKVDACNGVCGNRSRFIRFTPTDG
jgi:hypothetical protein